MSSITRDEILAEFAELLRRRGVADDYDLQTPLSDLDFRSLDFSELALRIERRIGCELSFDAAMLRKIEVVEDIVQFFAMAQQPC
jgi:acyl carrier protein